jgi:hypothetical protein
VPGVCRRGIAEPSHGSAVGFTADTLASAIVFGAVVGRGFKPPPGKAGG